MARIVPKPKRGHKESELALAGAAGQEFRLILRASQQDPNDFSVILAVRLPAKLFRLRRHNGRHWHTNKIERETFFDFHIHQATERYQAIGMKEETFAIPTVRFDSLQGAIECMLADANCREAGPVARLF